MNISHGLGLTKSHFNLAQWLLVSWIPRKYFTTIDHKCTRCRYQDRTDERGLSNCVTGLFKTYGSENVKPFSIYHDQFQTLAPSENTYVTSSNLLAAFWRIQTGQSIVLPDVWELRIPYATFRLFINRRAGYWALNIPLSCIFLLDRHHITLYILHFPACHRFSSRRSLVWRTPVVRKQKR